MMNRNSALDLFNTERGALQMGIHLCRSNGVKPSDMVRFMRASQCFDRGAFVGYNLQVPTLEGGIHTVRERELC